MIQFTFRFRNDINRAMAEMIYDQGHLRYRVSFGDDHWFTILPAGVPGPENKIIWVQSTKADERMQPHELVQALGEGIENLD